MNNKKIHETCSVKWNDSISNPMQDLNNLIEKYGKINQIIMSEKTRHICLCNQEFIDRFFIHQDEFLDSLKVLAQCYCNITITEEAFE